MSDIAIQRFLDVAEHSKDGLVGMAANDAQNTIIIKGNMFHRLAEPGDLSTIMEKHVDEPTLACRPLARGWG